MNQSNIVLIPPETNTDQHRTVLDAPDGRFSVKEAARLLGKSTSTVYRIDRVHGPFRIVTEKGRIYIDGVSFHQYLESRPAAQPIESLDNASETSLPPSTPECTPESTAEAEVIPETHEQDAVSLPSPAKTRSGQRELIIRRRQVPMVVLYIF